MTNTSEYPLAILGRLQKHTMYTLNILFLGDGFKTQKDKKVFEKVTLKVAAKIKKISPFNLKGKRRDEFVNVSRNINFFASFAFSDDRGISCNCPVDDEGVPSPGLTEGIYLEKKNTRFGVFVDVDGKYNINEEIVRDYISKCVLQNEENSGVPDCWLGGTSKGLVVMLINDDYGHARATPLLGFVPVGNDEGFNVIEEPTIKEDGKRWAKHSPKDYSIRSLAIGIIADVAVHELGHSGFDLGDEYEGPATDANNLYSDFEYPNVTAHNFAVDGDGKFTNLKWRNYIHENLRADIDKNGAIVKKECTGELETLPDGSTNYYYPDRTPERRGDTYYGVFPGYGNGRLVGVYEGAAGYRCGTYRPSALCRMRNADRSISGQRTRDFCLICKLSILIKIESLQTTEGRSLELMQIKHFER